MLRVHLTNQDLLGITVVMEPDPLCEALFSLDLLWRHSDELLFGAWRRRTQSRLSSAGVGVALRWLRDSPTGKRSWASMNPSTAVLVGDVVSGPHVRAPLTGAAGYDPSPPGGIDVPTGGAVAPRRLAAAVATYWRAGLQTYWGVVRAHVQADIEHRGHAVLVGGVSQLLATLHQNVQWRQPVLYICDGPDQDLIPNGRGLVLQPCFFCWPNPVVIGQTDQPAVLVYPVGRNPDWDHGTQDTTSRTVGLAALLGHTRAAVLAAAAGPGGSTTEIAHRVGMSLPTASQHTSILRSAGLITTRRHGGSVIHQTSPLGAALLNHGYEPPVSIPSKCGDILYEAVEPRASVMYRS